MGEKIKDRKTYSAILRSYRGMGENPDANVEEIKAAYEITEKIDEDERTYEKINGALKAADKSLSHENYIKFISTRRMNGYSKDAGGLVEMAEGTLDKYYASDPLKFVEEFLQNIDDCEYEEGKDPEVTITVNKEDSSITFRYNEEGFTEKDIWAITSYYQSNKTDDSSTKDDSESKEYVGANVKNGSFYREKTGRKGIGFKAVFTLPADNIEVHIQSNGYKFYFDKKIGQVLPIWEGPEGKVKNDGFTQITVNLDNGDSEKTSKYMEQVAGRLKELFCINSDENCFSNSAFLHMHRIRKLTFEFEHKNEDEENKDVKESYTIEYLPLDKELFEDEIGTIDKSQESADIYVLNEKTILAGIKKENDEKVTYYRKHYEEGIIRITSNIEKEKRDIPVVRYTEMVEHEKAYYNYSIIAPILKRDSSSDSSEEEKTEMVYEKGCLFRTFPLKVHDINIPLAIDAPFELNDARTGLQYAYVDKEKEIDATEWNKAVNNKLFGDDNGDDARCVLENFYEKLREIDDIWIDKYVPKEECILYYEDDNKHGNIIPTRDIQEIISKYKIYKIFRYDEVRNNINSDSIEETEYTTDGCYVNINDARTLPEECYKWECPEVLLESFSDDEDAKLISDIYIKDMKCRGKYLDLLDNTFVDSINKYLDKLYPLTEKENENKDEAFFENIEDISKYEKLFVNVSTFIRDNYAYLKDKHLGDLRLFYFRWNNGEYFRGRALPEVLWIYNPKGEYKSFLQIRCIGWDEKDKEYLDWIQNIHPITDIDSALDEKKFISVRKGKDIDRVDIRLDFDNDERIKFIKTLIYYKYENKNAFETFINGRYTFLKECAFDEECDDECDDDHIVELEGEEGKLTNNLFRDAYKEGNVCLKQLFDKDNLKDIAKASLNDEARLDDVKIAIKAIGLKPEEEFFQEYGLDTLFDLEFNEMTRELLPTLCTSRKRAEIVIRRIKKAYEKHRGWRLNVTYKDDFNECKENLFVFAEIFRQELVVDVDIQCNLAKYYCRDTYSRKFELLKESDESDDNTEEVFAAKEALLRAAYILYNKENENNNELYNFKRKCPQITINFSDICENGLIDQVKCFTDKVKNDTDKRSLLKIVTDDIESFDPEDDLEKEYLNFYSQEEGREAFRYNFHDEKYEGDFFIYDGDSVILSKNASFTKFMQMTFGDNLGIDIILSELRTEIENEVESLVNEDMSDEKPTSRNVKILRSARKNALSKIRENNDEYIAMINKAIINSEIFVSPDNSNKVSIANGFTVNNLFYRYYELVSDKNSCADTITEWFNCHSDGNDKYLILDDGSMVDFVEELLKDYGYGEENEEDYRSCYPYSKFESQMEIHPYISEKNEQGNISAFGTIEEKRENQIPWFYGADKEAIVTDCYRLFDDSIFEDEDFSKKEKVELYELLGLEQYNKDKAKNLILDTLKSYNEDNIGKNPWWDLVDEVCRLNDLEIDYTTITEAELDAMYAIKDDESECHWLYESLIGSITNNPSLKLRYYEIKILEHCYGKTETAKLIKISNETNVEFINRNNPNTIMYFNHLDLINNLIDSNPSVIFDVPDGVSEESLLGKLPANRYHEVGAFGIITEALKNVNIAENNDFTVDDITGYLNNNIYITDLGDEYNTKYIDRYVTFNTGSKTITLISKSEDKESYIKTIKECLEKKYEIDINTQDRKSEYVGISFYRRNIEEVCEQIEEDINLYEVDANVNGERKCSVYLNAAQIKALLDDDPEKTIDELSGNTGNSLKNNRDVFWENIAKKWKEF